MGQFTGEMTLLNYVLMAGMIWLSGVFVWLIKKFICSYGENTKVLTKVQDTLEGIDHKLDAASVRDVEIVRTLSAIHARQAPVVTVVEKDHDKSTRM